MKHGHACGCIINELGAWPVIAYCSTHEAAPDLLEALQGALDVLRVVHPGGNIKGAFGTIEAAIKKAEGK